MPSIDRSSSSGRRRRRRPGCPSPVGVFGLLGLGLLCGVATISGARDPTIVVAATTTTTTTTTKPTEYPQTVKPKSDHVSADAGELIFSTIIFRHGDRTPIEPYPTDPWASPKYWPEGFGQLTHIGKRQQYLLGTWIRQRYTNATGRNNILRPAYNPSDVYVRSTDYDRTLASALAHTAALYPAADPAVAWLADPNWLPVPVHTVPQADDYVLLANSACAQYDRLYAEMVRTHVEPMLRKHRHLIAYLERNTGWPIGSDLWRVNGIYDALYIEQLRNMTLPEWAQAIWSPSKDGDHFHQLADHAFVLETQTPELARLKYGWLVADILQRMRAKADRTLQPDRALWVYSGHDTTLSGVLNTLGLFGDVHGPPYASVVLFELRAIGDRPFVQVFYRKGWSTRNATNENEARLLTIPMCGEMCPLDRMFELYAHVMPKGSFEEECAVNGTERGQCPSGAARETVAGWCLVVVFVGIFISFVCVD